MNFTVAPTNLTAPNQTGLIGGGGGSTLVFEPFGMRLVRLAIYIIIFLIAVVGNALVVFVVYKTRELHTVTGYLIANLAVADFGVGLVCMPMTVVYFELDFHWPFGAVMCKLTCLQPFFLMASVGTLMAISIDRHQSIVYPFNARISITQGKLIITLIWLIALLPAFPMLGVLKQESAQDPSNPDKMACLENWPDAPLNPENSNLAAVYTIGSFLLTYAIPLPLIIILYIRIVLKLREAIKDAADRPGFQAAQQTKKIIHMLVAVVVCYALCYLPFHVLQFTMTYVPIRFVVKYLTLIYFQVIMYSNSASNPILYAFLGDQFRNGFKKAIGIKTRPKVNSSMSTRVTTVG